MNSSSIDNKETAAVKNQVNFGFTFNLESRFESVITIEAYSVIYEIILKLF